MPEETRVFDVSKPSRVSPSATSRPVIVGHHPMNDPMVKEGGPFAMDSSEHTKIPVSDDLGPADSDTASPMAVPISPHVTESQAPEEDAHPMSTHYTENESPAIFSSPPDDAPSKPPEPAFLTDPIDGERDHPYSSIPEGPFEGHEPPASDSHHSHGKQIEGLHFDEPKRGKSKLKWFVAAILVLFIGAYLAIDSGLVSANINLPFHIFKQKTETPVAPAASTPSQQASTPSLPPGFKEYKLAGTALTFAAPTAWGDPASTSVEGFSKRSQTSPQSDGTYAYIVTFATNKDIEIAVTSAKFLPPARAALYYDNLQWCTGTNDGKIYLSSLHFTTIDKVDTPATVTCDQGPQTTAQKLDDATILQPKAQDAAGKTLGDIYIKNLKDPSLVVFRVKDQASANGTQIKQLLDTIQISAASSSSNNSSSTSP